MTLRRKQGKKEASQLQLTMFLDKSLTESREADASELKDKMVGAFDLTSPPYLVDSRQARLTQIDLLLNDLRVEIHRLPTDLRYIARLILDALLEIRDSLDREGE